MRHHLAGEQVHIPSREIIREDTELEECNQYPEAGTLAHPLYAAQYSPGAPDQRVPVSMRASAVSLPPPNAPRLRMKFFIESIEV
jgi:hypothetical protein